MLMTWDAFINFQCIEKQINILWNAIFPSVDLAATEVFFPSLSGFLWLRLQQNFSVLQCIYAWVLSWRNHLGIRSIFPNLVTQTSEKVFSFQEIKAFFLSLNSESFLKKENSLKEKEGWQASKTFVGYTSFFVVLPVEVGISLRVPCGFFSCN